MNRTDATNGTDGASEERGDVDGYARWIAEQAGVSVEVARVAMSLVDVGLRSRAQWHVENARIIDAGFHGTSCQAGAPCDGWVPEGEDEFEDRQYDDDDVCPECEGSGTSWDGLCECVDCGGTGH